MSQKAVTETQIGNTRFIVVSECSPSATETIEVKLERLICRHFSDRNSYLTQREKSLAMFSKQSEYASDPNKKEA